MDVIADVSNFGLAKSDDPLKDISDVVDRPVETASNAIHNSLGEKPSKTTTAIVQGIDNVYRGVRNLIPGGQAVSAGAAGIDAARGITTGEMGRTDYLDPINLPKRPF